MPVAPQDIPKTAVITPFGLYKFLRMPFELRNARQSFQRFMDEVLEGLDCIFVYLDNILVPSNTVEEQNIHLEEVLKRLMGWCFIWRSACFSPLQWSSWGSTCQQRASARWEHVWRPLGTTPSQAPSHSF